MGEYYYLETTARKEPSKILHKRGCINLATVMAGARFLGTFYRPADALLTARKIHRECVICPYCCAKNGS